MGKTTKKDRRINAVLSVVLTILCIALDVPGVHDSDELAQRQSVPSPPPTPSSCPTAETFVGLKNYIYGIHGNGLFLLASGTASSSRSPPSR